MSGVGTSPQSCIRSGNITPILYQEWEHQPNLVSGVGTSVQSVIMIAMTAIISPILYSKWNSFKTGFKNCYSSVNVQSLVGLMVVSFAGWLVTQIYSADSVSQQCVGWFDKRDR